MFDTCQGFLNTRLEKFRDRTAPRLGRWTGTALLCGILAACGGGGDGGNAQAPHDPLAVFKQQKLDWQACDPKTVGEVFERALAILPERARCALMRVPLDYDNPGQGELKIELLRVVAQQPQRRLGTIAFNPGGPGMDGMGLALVSAILWAQARPGSFSDTQLREMGNRYDLIGFSPRGVGASNPLICQVSHDVAYRRRRQVEAGNLRQGGDIDVDHVESMAPVRPADGDDAEFRAPQAPVPHP